MHDSMLSAGGSCDWHLPYCTAQHSLLVPHQFSASLSDCRGVLYRLYACISDALPPPHSEVLRVLLLGWGRLSWMCVHR